VLLKGPPGVEQRTPCWWDEKMNRTWCLPAMMIIGAPKSGTTDIAQRLRVHPMLEMSRNKEPHWWTRCSRGEKYKPGKSGHSCIKGQVIRSFHNYLNHWDADKGVQTGGIAFEASASTYWEIYPKGLDGTSPTESVPERIHAAYKHHAKRLKLVVIMRDPVDRTWSDYNYFAVRLRIKEKKFRINKMKHEIKKTEGYTELDLDDATLEKKVVYKWPRPHAAHFHKNAKEAIRFLRACFKVHTEVECFMELQEDKALFRDSGRIGLSLYESLLRRWRELFGSGQLLMIRSNDYFRDAGPVIARVFKFLDVPISGIHNGKSGAGTATNFVEEAIKLPIANAQGDKVAFKEHSALNKTLPTDTAIMLREFFAPFEKRIDALVEMSDAFFERQKMLHNPPRIQHLRLPVLQHVIK
jgi:hypothetical protein